MSTAQAARGGPPLRKPSNAEVLGMGALSKLAASVLTYPPQASIHSRRIQLDIADGTLACRMSAAGLTHNEQKQAVGCDQKPTSFLQARWWQ